MIYSLTLQQVAIALGLIYILAHGWALWKPEQTRRFLLAAPRNYPLGVLLMLAAGLWFCGLIFYADLMDFKSYQNIFLLFAVAMTAAVIWYVREFLTARALGVLLLLLANVLLDAAFLRNEPSKLVITVLAYVYAVVGMFLVGSPYHLRDFLGWLYKTEKCARWAAWGGVAFGVVLLGLGLFVY
ncbi:MAG: hypothetical protein PHD76_08845 [Methylacidiphilales bacterium]|nr:hypothetical protein [Candidatus Methylacidiphilales bacterium]